MSSEASPTLMMLGVFSLFLSSWGVLGLGRKLPDRGSWLIWAALIAVLAGMGIDSGIFLKQDFQPKTWMTGWIWFKEEQGAITVGIIQDLLGLGITAFAVFVVGALLLNRGYLSQESRPEKTYAAIGLSTAGVALSWSSYTPWLVFVGMVLTSLGGFISLGSRWDSNGEATHASRFLWERVSGFLLCCFGASILASTRTALFLDSNSLWLNASEHFRSTWVGAILLVVGLFIQMQSFPILGWLVSPSEIYSPLRTLLCQIFPAWAAFALLFRSHAQFVNLGLFPIAGYVALASTVLTILPGIFQKSWRQGVASWLASGFSFAFAILALIGPFSALALLIGVSLGALILSSAGTSLELECIQSVANKQKAFWIRSAVLIASACGTGVLGFVSSSGLIRWISGAFVSPAHFGPFLLVFFLFNVLGWKQAWNIRRLQEATEASWFSVASLWIWGLLGLGMFWTGSVSGDIFLDLPDRVMDSFLGACFGSRASVLGSGVDSISVYGVYWGGVLASLIFAYWLSGRKEDQFQVFAAKFPKLSRFVGRGYGLDTIGTQSGLALTWIGKFTESWVDIKIWEQWVPKYFSLGVKSLARWISVVDQSVSSSLIRGLKVTVDVPSKVLQLIQTGDLRWYLFFALGSGFALLSHFLKS